MVRFGYQGWWSLSKLQALLLITLSLNQLCSYYYDDDLPFEMENSEVV